MNDTILIPHKRPTVITVLCVIGFIGAVLVMPMVFSDAARNVGMWYPPYLAFSGVIGLICNIGFWKMQKWAFYAYVSFFTLNQIVMLSTGTWLPLALIIPAVYIAILACYFKRMK